MKFIINLKNYNMDKLNESSRVYSEGKTLIESLKKNLISNDIKVEGPNTYLHPTKKTNKGENWMTHWITVIDDEKRERIGIIADKDIKPFFTLLIYDRPKFDSHSADIKEVINIDKEKDVIKFVINEIK